MFYEKFLKENVVILFGINKERIEMDGYDYD